MLMAPFKPLQAASAQYANTIALTVGAANATTALPATWGQSATQVRFYNNSTSIAFINFGKTAGEAVAAIPVNGTPAAGFPIAPGEDAIFTMPEQAAFIGVIGSAANGTLYASCGEGV